MKHTPYLPYLFFFWKVVTIHNKPFCVSRFAFIYQEGYIEYIKIRIYWSQIQFLVGFHPTIWLIPYECHRFSKSSNRYIFASSISVRGMERPQKTRFTGGTFCKWILYRVRNHHFKSVISANRQAILQNREIKCQQVNPQSSRHIPFMLHEHVTHEYSNISQYTTVFNVCIPKHNSSKTRFLT